MVSTLKFSQFVGPNDITNGAETVGLASGLNASFLNPWVFLPPGTTGDRPPISSAIYYQLRLNTSLQQYEFYDPISSSWVQLSTSLGTVESIEGTEFQVLANGTYGIPQSGTIDLTLPQDVNINAAFQVNSLQFNTGTGLLDNDGNELLTVEGISSAINNFQLQNNSTGFNPLFSVVGSDANIGANFQTKGTGAFTFIDGNGNNLLSTLTVASAINYFDISNAATGNPPKLVSAGTDSNISMTFQVKGTGSFNFAAGGLSNYLAITPAATGFPPSIQVFGGDTNIGLNFATKSAGAYGFNTTATTNQVIYSVSGIQSIFNFTATSGRTYTWPDASGTIALVGGGTLEWAANSNSSISAAVNNGYILTSGSSTTVTLPSIFAVGSIIGVAGQGAAWVLALAGGATIKNYGNTYSTSLASTNNTDVVVLLATVANTQWSILYMTSTGLTAS